MTTKEKELRNYISGTESFSGFDSYDSAEGDMEYFDDFNNADGDDFNNADGDYYNAAGSMPTRVESDPYVIQYTNTTTDDVTAVMFGFNQNAFSGVGNFGNPAAVVITNLQGATYGQLFAQSQNKVFKISRQRFASSTPAQLQQTITIAHTDANGNVKSSPLNLSVMLDSYQFQATVIDTTKSIVIDGNSQLSFTLKASATFVISLYPTSVISGKAVLNGGSALNKAYAKPLSGKNVAPVIIQTSQAVKGITKG
jgi:hypothetical protein